MTKQEIKQKWIAALRSGEYRQGTTRLHLQNGGFCCLGVLCDLAVKEGVIPAGEPHYSVADHINTGCFTYGAEKAIGFLPAEVSEWAGVSSSGRYGGKYLYQDNDQDGLSFNQIADIIENYEGFGKETND